jgi:signal transduction histidine kinase
MAATGENRDKFMPPEGGHRRHAAPSAPWVERAVPILRMNPSNTLILSDTPVSAAVMAAFVLATLALLFIALARRDHEPGMAWLATGFGLAAFWYFFEATQPPASRYLETVPDRLWSTTLSSAVMAMSIGVIRYLGQTDLPRRWRWYMLTAPIVVTIACFALGVPVLRLVANLALMVCYIGAGVLAFRRSAAEPGAGHIFLGLALLAVPATYGLLLTIHADPGSFRILGVMPILFFGMTLLTVSLLRRRRALESEIAGRAAAEDALNDVNRNLEATVAERTVELQELVASLEGFNRSVSHDLRGPLGGIAGLARLAADAIGTGDLDMVHRSLAAISAQAETSTKLISALLQLAHVGDAKLARRTVALAALTRDVIAQLRLGQPASNTTAATQWIVGELPDVQADADLLRPVLVNLMANALKFSRDAHPPIVRIEASVDDHGVTVHVRDNGVGFAPDAAGQLFQPFMRLHGRRFEGHGIGLSIVRRAVERHGGRVWADAAPDQGAAFHFTLPKAA